MSYKRIDKNHTAIVEALRERGCSVQSIAGVGRGCPDLLVGKNGVNIVMEIKNGSLPPSKQLLTDDELLWHSRWNGHVHIVHSVEEALAALKLK